ncbi:NaeI family type II restriction endonuclease, partial [Hyphomonas sp.]|uniref:NaeI family type II restriction endonuclease n=1 Tax=Hyphomonas sp. TaxID=87 RepID=UPI0030FA3F7F
IQPEIVDKIFSGSSGNRRVMTLFREVQKVPITRDVVEAVARQKDFMRRLRADNGKGTRDHLASVGILLLSGQFDHDLIDEFQLPFCDGSEFISYRPVGSSERAAAEYAGLPALADNDTDDVPNGPIAEENQQ